jgi:release factor glutamine methyltransferase
LPEARPPLSVIEVIKKTSDFLASKQVESPRLNAELIVGHALALPRMRLYIEFERPVSEPELTTIRELVRLRGKRLPLQHILGHTEFSGLTLKTDVRALIPRPETELLVELIAERCAAPPARLLDLGTGSGAIALALASRFPGATAVALDNSLDAIALARENALSTGLEGRVLFSESNWYDSLRPEKVYDLIVSNPPYLTEEEAAASAPEVRLHEPGAALVAADGGFRDIQTIVEGSPEYLAPGGMLAIETGIGHHGRLAQLLSETGYMRTEPLKDLTGRDRFMLAWR